MKQHYFILFFLVLALLLGIFIYLFYDKMPASPVANIYIDGELYRSIPMQTLTTPVELEIQQDNGKKNTVVVTSTEVYMQSADCPDKLCVQQGAIQSSLLPIVCLPNHITVTITGEEDHTNIDAVSG